MAKKTINPSAEGSGFSVEDMNSKDFEVWRNEVSDYIKKQGAYSKDYATPSPTPKPKKRKKTEVELPNTTGP